MQSTPAGSAYHSDRPATPRSQTTVSPAHRRMLEEGSSISADVIRARGYESVARSGVPDAFKPYQRRRGLLIPTTSPSGRTSHQLRVDTPRREGLRYEAPAGSKVMLDVHPFALEEVRNGCGDLWLVEGTKKGDALVSRGIAALALAGVWMAHVPKSNPKALLPCFDNVGLEGREVIIGFDSDWTRKQGVHDALRWVAGALEKRGALVKVLRLEDAPDGRKRGVDDALAGGATVEEMRVSARPFKTVDVGEVRLSRDRELRAGVEDLTRTWRTMPAATRGQCSTRDLFLAYVQEAARSGKVCDDGIRVRLPQGTAALRAKLSRRTIWKSLGRLEEAGLINRETEGKKRGQTVPVVLRCAHRASVSQVKGGSEVSGAVYPSDLHPRAPRLMWSSPGSKPRRGTVAGTRKVREGPPPAPRPASSRLGKVRGAILDVLDISGGTATLQEIAAAMGRKRPRDIRRRLLPWLEEGGIIEVEGDTVGLALAWLDRLEEQRRLGGEIEAEQVARRELATRREAYREQCRRPRKRPAPSPESVAAVERSHRRREAEMMRQARPVTELEPAPAVDLRLLEALHDYLARNPNDHPDRHPPDERRVRTSLLGSSLWALDMLTEKPPRVDIEVALAELQGVAA